MKGCIVVQVFARSSKFSLFDPAKEMVRLLSVILFPLPFVLLCSALDYNRADAFCSDLSPFHSLTCRTGTYYAKFCGEGETRISNVPFRRRDYTHSRAEDVEILGPLASLPRYNFDGLS
jgi:hypothetical protein